MELKLYLIFQKVKSNRKIPPLIMKNITALLILTLSINSFCYGQDTYTYFQPKDLGDGWKTNDLKSQNVDTTLIYKMFSQLKNRKNEVHSVLLIKNDQLIIEEYFKGHSANQPHDLRSATKEYKINFNGNCN